MSLIIELLFIQFQITDPKQERVTREEVFSCFAGLYEPTQKDVQLGNLETSKRSVTINIRNAQPDFLPTVNHVFEIKNGMYAGLTFDIKNVAPAKTPNYIKVVGEES
ncbi:hypothetical protein CoNPh25_CDS0013 [Staphylococcus phage S-CoN_Ph25]|nr:hypothetical protein CoNPh25_CDS0013 [Staphylococcus phage S-CoN_Ph25]